MGTIRSSLQRMILLALPFALAATPAAAFAQDHDAEPGRAQGFALPVTLETTGSDAAGLQAAVATEVESTWTFAGAFYLHAASISGTQVIGGVQLDIDVGFSDLFDKLDGAFSGHFEGRNGDFGFGVDYVWVNVGEEGIEVGPPDGPGALPLEGAATMTTSTFELFGTYQLGDTSVGPGALDFILGTRYKSLANTVTITGPIAAPGVDLDTSWWDLMFGARWLRQAGDRVLVIGRADFGTDAWNVQGGAAINVWNWLDVVIEYKHIKYNRNEGTGDLRFIYDASESGPLFGIGVHF